MTEEEMTMLFQHEKKVMDQLIFAKCLDCDYDLSAFDAYQGTCQHCEDKK